MSKVYAVVDTFVGFGGQSVWLGAGDEYDASDPLVKAHPGKFTKETSPVALAAEERTRIRRRSS